MKTLLGVAAFVVLAGCASTPPPAPSNPATPPDSTPAATPTPITPQVREQRAATTLQRIEAHDFARSREWFDDTMRAQSAGDALRDAWDHAESQVGSFQSQTFNGATRVNGYIALDFDLTFQKGHLRGRVVFDDAGRVAGLFFLPPA